MIKVSRHIILLFFQFICLGVFSQKQNIKFEHLDINSGLSQNQIMCILQDSRGFMWFGTRDGLNRYDGYEFTIYKNKLGDSTSLSNDFITGIVEDRAGIIWVATRGGGLNRYDKEKNSFVSFKNDPAVPNSISSDLLSGLLCDEEGNLWISTEDAGINYYQPAKDKVLRYRHDKNNTNSLSDDNTRYIYSDSRHNIWVGTYGGGLNLLNRKSGEFTHFMHDHTNKNSLSNNNVRVIFEDSRRRIWVGTVGGGLELYQEQTGTFRHFVHEIGNKNSLSNNVVAALGEDMQGNLWIGTENGGLNIYDKAGRFQCYINDEIDNSSLSHNSIYSIYKDGQGTIWVGTFAGGVNVFSRYANRFVHYKRNSSGNSLSHNNVLCIEEDRKGKLWIGTDGGGLNHFDPSTGEFTPFVHDDRNRNSICGNSVLDICEDAKGNIWVGTWANGLTIFNPEKKTYQHFKNIPGNASSLSNNNVWAIFRDNEENIWIGTYGGGLHLYDAAANSFIRFDDTTSSIVVKQIYSIAEDKKGNLWVGTDGGGVRIFDKKKRAFTGLINKERNNSLSDDRINYIYQDKQDHFWLCTMSGLNYYDSEKNEFITYTTEDGLPNNVIFGITEDSTGSFWISTNRGLSRFNHPGKVFKNFGMADGLQSYEFKGHSLSRARSGKIYFGGINGFNEFDPVQIHEKPFDPPLVLTDFQIFNKKVPIARDEKDPSPLKKDISETNIIRLPYNQSVISFEFASLYYASPERKQYAYMLEGFDDTWNEIGFNRSATYTNLDPGKYIFKVKGLNSEGIWSPRNIAVQLIITPPFWLTWWFRISVILVFIGGILAIYTYRVRAIKAQRAKLQKLVKAQTRQLSQSAEEEHRARQEAEEANKELERKNKELEQFAYVASHDMQEPLRTTASFIDLLQKQYKGKLDEKADKYFTYVLQSSDRMRILIQDLLDYSRIGRKQEREQVDCNVVMQDVLADLAVAIRENNAIIQYDTLPIIWGHATEIKLLFQNLVINAIKFRKKNVDPQVKISAVKAGEYWRFSCRDNGIGMDEKHGERVFIIFQRLHNRNEYNGSGIGLAHCKKIVELHGGRIWFESTPGAGTTFFFTLREKPETKTTPVVSDISE